MKNGEKPSSWALNTVFVNTVTAQNFAWEMKNRGWEELGDGWELAFKRSFDVFPRRYCSTFPIDLCAPCPALLRQKFCTRILLALHDGIHIMI